MILYAIVETNNEETILRIPVSQEVQAEINEMLTAQYERFFQDKEIVVFDGDYNADETEIFEIGDYDLSQDILNSATNPLNYELLNIDTTDGRIKSVYLAVPNNGNPEFYFQYFDARKIIANRGISLFLNGDIYRRVDNRGIVIANSITAIFRNGNLYFSSYFNARKCLDLLTYYEEATDEDITNFMQTQVFRIGDQAGLTDTINSQLRKKIRAIQQRGVLDNIDLQGFADQAQQFDMQFTIENDQIVIPEDDTVYLKTLLKFLDEDYFITPLTGRRCVTNSKREI